MQNTEEHIDVLSERVVNSRITDDDIIVIVQCAALIAERHSDKICDKLQALTESVDGLTEEIKKGIITI